jgi:hypothetical protein
LARLAIRTRAIHQIGLRRRIDDFATLIGLETMRPVARCVCQQAQIPRAAIVFDAEPGDFHIDIANDDIFRVRDLPWHLAASADGVQCSQLSKHAIGFRSDAYTSQPMRAASSRNEPPPQNGSPTRGRLPKRRPVSEFRDRVRQ